MGNKMEHALNEFITFWKNKEYIVGILLSGSYAVGLENEKSDIDIRLILDSRQEKSFKGLQEINGYSFSYLANTKESISDLFNIDFFSNSKIEARIFSVGKILYDKTGALGELKKISKYYFELPFIEKIISEDDRKIIMHTIYSKYTSLMERDSESPFFLFNYMIFMRQVLNSYFHILNMETVTESKWEKILTDRQYSLAYNFELFPDQKFIKLWIKSVSIENICKESSTAVYEYIRKKIYLIDKKSFIIYMNVRKIT
jgi:predicted nucleotidyltransferase